MTKTIIIVSVLCLMSACAPKMWIKDGVTQEQFYQHKTDCQKIAGSIAGSNPLILGTAFSDCMRERGYEYTTAD